MHNNKPKMIRGKIRNSLQTDCEKCIFPLLRGCPVMGSKNNAACLNMYKDRTSCKSEDCTTCRWYKYCLEKNINLNKEE